MRKLNFLVMSAILLCILAGCEKKTSKEEYVYNVAVQEETGKGFIMADNTITELDDGFSAVRFDGDYGFEGFLSQGGAKSDAEVIKYLASKLASDAGSMAKLLSDETIIIAALYAPLDGMNEKGLCVAVNMIQDSDTISQSSGKPNIINTTAVRMLLNKAATTNEAVELLKQYDFHASMDYMVHLSVADSTGKSVVIEYINNEMEVIETPFCTDLQAGF